MSEDKDILRDTWARYLGYANEVGESFRAVVPVKMVRASYGLAFAYVLADTADKGVRMLVNMCILRSNARQVPEDTPKGSHISHRRDWVGLDTCYRAPHRLGCDLLDEQDL